MIQIRVGVAVDRKVIAGIVHLRLENLNLESFFEPQLLQNLANEEVFNN
jgi:hypothetical protein